MQVKFGTSQKDEGLDDGLSPSLHSSKFLFLSSFLPVHYLLKQVDLSENNAMISITEQTIDTMSVLDAVASNSAGAALLFVGTTREFTEGRKTASLDYQCYGQMAKKELAKLVEEAEQQWTLTGCAIVHRVGHVGLGEASVAIAVSSPHRVAAFEAGQWLIDTLKKRVPIWKKENWADGATQWVHPGVDADVLSRAGGSD